MNIQSLAILFEETATTDGSGLIGTLGMIIPLALLAVVFYFFIYRPQKKQEKETTEMRNSLEIGDVIVTAGGIVGMIVKITEDMLLIETSGNRTKIQLQKWAVHSVIERANEPAEIKDDSSKSKEKKEKKDQK